jgi:hypothetical protein
LLDPTAPTAAPPPSTTAIAAAAIATHRVRVIAPVLLSSGPFSAQSQANLGSR